MLVDLHRRIQFGQFLLQQLQIRIDKAQLQRNRVLHFAIDGRLVQILGAGAQPQLFVDLLVQLAALRLQLGAACDRSRIGALRVDGICPVIPDPNLRLPASQTHPSKAEGQRIIVAGCGVTAAAVGPIDGRPGR